MIEGYQIIGFQKIPASWNQRYPGILQKDVTYLHRHT